MDFAKGRQRKKRTHRGRGALRHGKDAGPDACPDYERNGASHAPSLRATRRRDHSVRLRRRRMLLLSCPRAAGARPRRSPHRDGPRPLARSGAALLAAVAKASRHARRWAAVRDVVVEFRRAVRATDPDDALHPRESRGLS